MLRSWWTDFVAWVARCSGTLQSWWADFIAWIGRCVDILISWWAKPAAGVLNHCKEISTCKEIGIGIRDRLTEANAFKVVLLLSAL
jgi:hypothetical protein